MVDVAVTKYWVKWDKEENAKFTTRLNITRMFEELLKNKHTPEEVKVEIAKEVNNAASKKFLAEFAVRQQRTSSAAVLNAKLEKEELELRQKQKKACASDVQRREAERQQAITNYVNCDPPLPEAQFDLCLYLLSVTLLMCRLPFALVTNDFFRTFLKALRPTFEKKLRGVCSMH